MKDTLFRYAYKDKEEVKSKLESYIKVGDEMTISLLIESLEKLEFDIHMSDLFDDEYNNIDDVIDRGYIYVTMINWWEEDLDYNKYDLILDFLNKSIGSYSAIEFYEDKERKLYSNSDFWFTDGISINVDFDVIDNDCGCKYGYIVKISGIKVQEV